MLGGTRIEKITGTSPFVIRNDNNDNSNDDNNDNNSNIINNDHNNNKSSEEIASQLDWLLNIYFLKEMFSNVLNNVFIQTVHKLEHQCGTAHHYIYFYTCTDLLTIFILNYIITSKNNILNFRLALFLTYAFSTSSMRRCSCWALIARVLSWLVLVCSFTTHQTFFAFEIRSRETLH